MSRPGRSDRPSPVCALHGKIDPVTFDERRNALVAALEQGAVNALPTGDLASPDEALQKALKEIEAQDAALREGKLDDLLTKLKAEHLALRQKQVLSKNIKDVIDFVEDLAWPEKADHSRPRNARKLVMP